MVRWGGISAQEDALFRVDIADQEQNCYGFPFGIHDPILADAGARILDPLRHQVEKHRSER